MDAPCLGCGDAAPDRPPMEAITDDLTPLVDPDVAFTVIGGSVVLYDRERGATHVLNSTAALIWSTIADGTTVGQLIEQLAEVVGVEPLMIGVDVRTTLAQFWSKGIVTFSPPIEGGPAPRPERPDLTRPGADERYARILERVTWCGSKGAVQAAGTSVLVRTNAPDLDERFGRVLASLPPATEAGVTLSVVDRGGDDRRRRFGIFVDSTAVTWAATPDSAADLALSELNRLAIERTPGRLLFHGGATERDGSAVMVVGPSGYGKSTLTASLVQHGFGYLTDELVVIDPADLTILPYPKALDLGSGSLDLVGLELEAEAAWGAKAKVHPDRLGSTSAGARLRLVVVLAPSGPDVERVVELDPVDAIIEVLRNTFVDSMKVPDALGGLARLCEVTPVIRIARLSLDEARQLIEERLR